MAFMTLDAAIIGEATDEGFKDYCEHFDCEAKKKHGIWTVTSHDPSKFFWLGMNLTLHVDTPQMQSPAAKYLKPDYKREK